MVLTCTRFGGEGPIIIGGVRIPYEKGLLAHLDGDVALHALTDALLGAAALGDIGKLFPDTDPAFKGADSRELLRREAWRRIRCQGLRSANVDVTIIACAPKMLPHIPQMRVLSLAIRPPYGRRQRESDHHREARLHRLREGSPAKRLRCCVRPTMIAFDQLTAARQAAAEQWATESQSEDFLVVEDLDLPRRRRRTRAGADLENGCNTRFVADALAKFLRSTPVK